CVEGTWAPVAISSAASFITPNVWKANTQSSLSHTVGCTHTHIHTHTHTHTQTHKHTHTGRSLTGPHTHTHTDEAGLCVGANAVGRLAGVRVVHLCPYTNLICPPRHIHTH